MGGRPTATFISAWRAALAAARNRVRSKVRRRSDILAAHARRDIGANAAASSQPRFMPCPPMAHLGAASPILTTRPATIRGTRRVRTPKRLSMLLVPASMASPVRSRTHP